jgi:XTP/dITP diphosphohydrolase
MAATPIIIASHNEGKVSEIRALLAPLGFKVSSAAELHLPEPEETGSTFEANASLKARAAEKAFGIVSLADDSGLVVPALGGDPGIFSARWAGPEKDFSKAMRKIEQELLDRGHTPTGMAAYFVCVLAIAYPEREVRTLRGEVHGHLTFPARGEHGFGYDPIFVPAGYAQTFGQMSPEAKNKMSHRAVAFAQLVDYMKKDFAA